MKTRFAVGLCSLFIVISLCTVSVYANDIYPEKHSRDEIQKYVLNSEKYFNVKTSYTEKPRAKKPYKTGKVSQDSLNAGLKIMNMFRYIAGISPVKLDEQYNKYAQAAAVLDEAAGILSHNPKKPADMPDDFYRLGCKGTGGSNLYSGGSSHGLTVADGVIGWVSDNDNVTPGVGHRIWTLDPNMKKVGFGISENYRAMYVFDSVDTGLGWYSPDIYRNIIWPAAETPLDYFDNAGYWSIRTGDSEIEKNISISVTDKSTETSYAVKKSYITVQSGYACSDVVVFKSPIKKPEDGVTYTVNISGLTQGKLSYDVHFFKVHKPSVPALSGIKNTSSGVKFTWKTVSDATNYVVYRKTGNGSYKKLATVKGSVTAYTDKSVKTNTKYTYTVAGSNTSGTGSYSKTGKTIFFLSAPTAKVANKNGYINISWNKISGAKGYVIYKKTGSGSYKKLATIKSGSTVFYKDKSVKSGTTYSYYVKAYNGSTYSGYKSGVTIIYLTAVKVFSATSTKSGITVKWDRVAASKGYIVYRKTGSGKYTKLATVKGNAKVSYVDKSAKKGTTYTYCIKSYSGSYSGAYANTVSCKDKY